MNIIIKDQIDTILSNNDLSGIKIRDCKWKVKTAGPSPCKNERTELFLLGCEKAINGSPCKGCFNQSTWDVSKAVISHDPIKMAEHINENAPNKYITIGGGEPTDQIDNLIILCKELKKYGFHIIMYTWKSLKEILTQSCQITFSKESISKNESFENKLLYLMQYIDIVIDGEYKEEERLWDGTKEDGLISSIGSGNQIVWDIKNKRGIQMKYIKSLSLLRNNNLHFLLKDSANRFITLN